MPEETVYHLKRVLSKRLHYPFDRIRMAHEKYSSDFNFLTSANQKLKDLSIYKTTKIYVDVMSEEEMKEMEKLTEDTTKSYSSRCNDVKESRLWTLIDRNAHLINIEVELPEGGRYNGVVDMPNLKTLSERGTTYLNAYTNNPICVPSRSALWSGMHTHITESWNNFKGLPDGFNDTWKDRLQQAGYATKVLGKVDIHSGAHSLSNRVEAWTRKVAFALRQEGRPTVQLAGNETTQRVNVEDWGKVDEAVKYINSVKTSKDDNPFMLYVGLNIPHPYPTPSEGENFGASTFRTSPYWLKKVNASKINIPPWIPKDQMHPVDLYSTIAKNCSSEFSKEELMAIKMYFYAMCAETDGMVGEILQALDQNHLSESTYVIFASDHGELAMEHRQFYKMSMYEGSSHVPLILSWPTSFAHHQVEFDYKSKKTMNSDLDLKYVESPVSLIDIYPTLMQIAGLSPPQHLNGTSLFGQPPAWILSQFHGCNVNASTYMLRLGSWKYITFDNGLGHIKPLLFNLTEDPDELSNVAGLHPTLVTDFDKHLMAVVDYRRVEKYNKQSFMEWKNSEGKEYNTTIANLRWWMDWQKAPEKNQEAIDRWLNTSDG